MTEQPTAVRVERSRDTPRQRVSTALDTNGGAGTDEPRTDWTRDEIAALFDLPLIELLGLLGRNKPRVGCELEAAAEL